MNGYLAGHFEEQGWNNPRRWTSERCRRNCKTMRWSNVFKGRRKRSRPTWRPRTTSVSDLLNFGDDEK
eukprot:1762471-Prorocentrum_lima.AAC.1